MSNPRVASVLHDNRLIGVERKVHALFESPIASFLDRLAIVGDACSATAHAATAVKAVAYGISTWSPRSCLVRRSETNCTRAQLNRQWKTRGRSSAGATCAGGDWKRSTRASLGCHWRPAGSGEHTEDADLLSWLCVTSAPPQTQVDYACEPEEVTIALASLYRKVVRNCLSRPSCSR